MIRKKQGVIICQDDGELLISPQDGEMVWVGVCSPQGKWYREQGFKSVSFLQGVLNLDHHEAPAPECQECDSYEACRACLLDENEEPDSMYCSAVDADATAASILAALAMLSEDEKGELFCTWSF